MAGESQRQLSSCSKSPETATTSLQSAATATASDRQLLPNTTANIRSSSCILSTAYTAETACSSSSCSGSQPTLAGKPAATAPTMETRSSKKRKVILSPVNTSPSPLARQLRNYTNGRSRGDTNNTPRKREDPRKRDTGRSSASPTTTPDDPALPQPIPCTVHEMLTEHAHCTAYITEIAQDAICNMCCVGCVKNLNENK